MASRGFDPNKFIDREAEQGLFEELLTFKTAARILSIRAVSGDGKSQLLEKFQHRCRTRRPRTPVSLIALDQLHDNSPLSLIKLIAEHLSVQGIRLENFARYESARVDADFKTIRASAYFQGANFSGAKDIRIGAFMTNLERADTVNVSTNTIQLSPEQEKVAQDVVVRSFFDDLHAYCAISPVVIMLDTFEKCEAGLKEWIVNHFLERNFFTDGCEACSLALVIAGKETPDFYLYWSTEECDLKVRSVKELGKWTKEHVEECMQAHGFNDYEAQDLDAFYRLIEIGIPPSQVVQAIQTALAARRGQL